METQKKTKKAAEPSPGEKFAALTKRLVNVPKEEIDKRMEQHQACRGREHRVKA